RFSQPRSETWGSVPLWPRPCRDRSSVGCHRTERALQARSHAAPVSQVFDLGWQNDPFRIEIPRVSAWINRTIPSRSSCPVFQPGGEIDHFRIEMLNGMQMGG